MDHIEALKELAGEYAVRSPQKLLQLARKIGAKYTFREAQQALSTNVPAQTLGPPPRSLGHSQAERPGSRLQADLADFRRVNTLKDAEIAEYQERLEQVDDL